MKLLLRRRQRVGLRRIYVLDVRGHFSEEELSGIRAHGLTKRQLYSRLEMADRGRGLLGLLFRSTFGAANLTVTMGDLVQGKRIECDDLVEVLAIEDAIRKAARFFNQVVGAGAEFDDEEEVEL